MSERPKKTELIDEMYMLVGHVMVMFDHPSQMAGRVE